MAHLYADLPELTTKFRVVNVNEETVKGAHIEGQLVHVTFGNGEKKMFAGYQKIELVELRNPIRKATASVTKKQVKGVLRPGKTARKRRREEEARKRLRKQEEKAQKAEEPKKEEKTEPVKVFISLMGCGCIVERANDPVCVQHDNSEVIDQEEAK